jgi:hypothetical protein
MAINSIQYFKCWLTFYPDQNLKFKMTFKLYQNVYPYLEWALTFCTGFTLKVLLRILSIVNILNTAYPFRPKFYPP